MKRLSMFNKFQFNEFNKGKKYQITGVRYNEKRNCITIDIVIVEEDSSIYGDVTVSNLYEKFKVHCIQDTSESDIGKYSIGQMIVFKNIGKCSVYGSYNDQLSVEAIVEVAK